MGYIMMGVMMTIYCVYLIVIYIIVNVFTKFGRYFSDNLTTEERAKMLWISIFPIAWGANELLRVCQPHDSSVYLPNPGCSDKG